MVVSQIMANLLISCESFAISQREEYLALLMYLMELQVPTIRVPTFQTIACISSTRALLHMVCDLRVINSLQQVILKYKRTKMSSSLFGDLYYDAAKYLANICRPLSMEYIDMLIENKVPETILKIIDTSHANRHVSSIATHGLQNILAFSRKSTELIDLCYDKLSELVEKNADVAAIYALFNATTNTHSFQLNSLAKSETASQSTRMNSPALIDMNALHTTNQLQVDEHHEIMSSIANKEYLMTRKCHMDIMNHCVKTKDIVCKVACLRLLINMILPEKLSNKELDHPDIHASYQSPSNEPELQKKCVLNLVEDGIFNKLEASLDSFDDSMISDPVWELLCQLIYVIIFTQPEIFRLRTIGTQEYVKINETNVSTTILTVRRGSSRRTSKQILPNSEHVASHPITKSVQNIIMFILEKISMALSTKSSKSSKHEQISQKSKLGSSEMHHIESILHHIILILASMSMSLSDFHGIRDALNRILEFTPLLKSNESSLRGLATILYNISCSSVNSNESTLILLHQNQFYLPAILGKTLSIIASSSP